MSNDGDASNRLSAALDQIFSRSEPGERAGDDAHDVGEDVNGDAVTVADTTPGEPAGLPDIVPATEEPRDPVGPTLPTRITTPAPASTPAPAAPPASAPPRSSSAATSAAPPAPAAGPTTSWSDHVNAVPANARSSGLRAPGRKPRVRRVTRVLRHIDPWSTFKVALLFSLVLYLVGLTSGVLLWRVADRTGTLDNVERWFTQFGWETFELKGGEIFQNAWVIGLFGVVAMTGGLVLLATVFNLVSDIIGGVRLTVLEEEVVERTVSSTRRYVVRQGPTAAGAVPAQQWDVDDDRPSGEPARTTAPMSATPDTATPATTPTADWSVDD